MVSLEIIEREINELEGRDTTYAVCERLSWLYTVRDHLRPTRASGERESGLTNDLRGSEFLEAASGVSYPELMKVLDEHMQTLQIVYPRTYEAIMAKIRALH